MIFTRSRGIVGSFEGPEPTRFFRSDNQTTVGVLSLQRGTAGTKDIAFLCGSLRNALDDPGVVIHRIRNAT